MMTRRGWDRVGMIAAHAVLMAGALVMVMPMLWMVATAFQPAPEIALWPPVFLPKAPSFETFTGAFETAPFARFFLNSLLIANDQMLFNMKRGLTAFQFRFSADTGKLMAGSVVSTAPMLVIFLLMRRRIIENMALTGIK